MPRQPERYADGEYWLDKRRDGKSPDIWQIARYSPKSRSVIYRSTKQRSLEDAKLVLHSYAAEQRSKAPDQPIEQADLVPHLTNYCREHGQDVVRLDTAKSSFRAIIGFLQQDELGTGAKVADMNKVALARFRRWRMGPHEWAVEWGGKLFEHSSQGVSGEAVQRNLEDLRAALNHAEAAGRIVAPKIPMVRKALRSDPRDRVLTFEEIGAVWGYARMDWPVWRELCLIIATACRPGAAMDFDPAKQWHGETLDLLPPGQVRTKKRRPIVPVIEPLARVLHGWRVMPHKQVASRKRWWRTARRALNLEKVEGYTIRHTLLTYLGNAGVPMMQVEGLAGHAGRGTTSRHYMHYDADNAPELIEALTTFWNESERAADQWCADHRRTKAKRGKPLSIDTIGRKG